MANVLNLIWMASVGYGSMSIQIPNSATVSRTPRQLPYTAAPEQAPEE